VFYEFTYLLILTELYWEMHQLLYIVPGGMGCATKMKLVVSMLVGTTLAGLSESLALSTKLGLNITDVLEVLRHSSANSQFIREKGAGKFCDRNLFINCRHVS